MTKEEILGIATGQAAALQNANSLLNRFNQPAQEPQNRFDLDVPDDQYIDGRQLKQIVQRFANQAPQVDLAGRAMAAQNAFGLVRLQFPDEFKRWEAEIRTEANKLPQDYWNVDNLATIVRLVRSNHIDDLVAEKAKQFVNESHPTIRSGSGGSGSVPNTQSVFESGSPDMLARLRAAGITSDADLTRECQGTGISPDQFLAEFAKYGKSAIVRG